MGLVLRLEVQVGAAVLVEDPAGSVADDGVLGFVHLAEDLVQGFQLLGCEARLGEKKRETEMSKLKLTTLNLALTSLSSYPLCEGSNAGFCARPPQICLLSLF